MKLVIYGSFNCPYSFLASQRVDHLVELGVAWVEWRAVVHDTDVPPEGLTVSRELAETFDRELEEIRGLLSAATFDEHEDDTITEHHLVNVLSPSCSSW
jgi:hypothetical protein